MIRERLSLSMAEAAEFIKGDENVAELGKFIKKFSPLDAKKAKDLRKQLEELNLMKIKSDSISKIIDVLPMNSEDLNKIFVDFSLDENEAQKVLDAVKQFAK